MCSSRPNLLVLPNVIYRDVKCLRHDACFLSKRCPCKPVRSTLDRPLLTLIRHAPQISVLDRMFTCCTSRSMSSTRDLRKPRSTRVAVFAFCRLFKVHRRQTSSVSSGQCSNPATSFVVGIRGLCRNIASSETSTLMYPRRREARTCSGSF